MTAPEDFDILSPSTFDFGHPHDAYDRIRAQGV